MAHRCIVFLSIAILVTACASAHKRETAGIVQRVQSIQQERDPDKRAELSMELSGHIKSMGNKATVEPAAVDKIAELLDDESARLGAAASLREIGPGARNAIPALKRVLADLRSRVLIHNQTLPLIYLEAALKAIETGA